MIKRINKPKVINVKRSAPSKLPSRVCRTGVSVQRLCRGQLICGGFTMTPPCCCLIVGATIAGLALLGGLLATIIFIITSTTSTATTSTTTTTTSTACGTANTACTSCTSSCSSGLMLLLSQSNSSAWGAGGTGFTTYQYYWIAPSTTTATIQFQFFTTSSGNYWDIDNVSIKDSTGVEKITNGGFISKASWNETCSMSGCASIQNYGPSLSPDYWINCISTSNYYSVSQTFTTVPCAAYNVSFDIARYKTNTNTANAYIYIY
ncbi:unnamed protein product [Rotaria socialis]